MLVALIMMMETFYVATYIDVQPGSTREGTQLIEQYRQASRAEDGNLGVEVVEEIGRPNRYAIIEAWKDQQSFEAHEKGATTIQFRSKLKAIHNSPYDQRVHHDWSVSPVQ